MNQIYLIEEYSAGSEPSVDIQEWINENMLNVNPELQLDIHVTRVTHAQLVRVYAWYMDYDGKDEVYMHQFFDVPSGESIESKYWSRVIPPQKTFKHDTPYEYTPVKDWNVEHSYVPDETSEDNPIDEPFDEDEHENLAYDNPDDILVDEGEFR